VGGVERPFGGHAVNAVLVPDSAASGHHQRAVTRWWICRWDGGRFTGGQAEGREEQPTPGAGGVRLAGRGGPGDGAVGPLLVAPSFDAGPECLEQVMSARSLSTLYAERCRPFVLARPLQEAHKD
jgi:hypothetical protein